MLRNIRNHANSWVIKGLLGFLVLSFALWGIGDFLTGRMDTTALKIGDERVSVYTLKQAYENQKRQLAAQFGGQAFPAELDQMIQQQILRDAEMTTLLKVHARKLGAKVDDAMVLDSLKKMGAFNGPDGQFSPDIYRATLRNAGFKEESFEQLLRGDLLAEQVRMPYLRATFTDKASLERTLKFLKETRDARVLVVTTLDIPAATTPTEQDLRNLYERIGSRFQTEEQRDADVLVLSTAGLTSTLAVTDDELKAAYDADPKAMEKPEERRARHILVKDKAEAEALLKRLTDGADFAALAKEASLDKASAVDGGDLGWFTRGRMVPEFEKPAFELPKGGRSGVVESPFGFHILEVTDVRAPQTVSFADAKEGLKKDLLAKKAEDALFELTEKADDLLGSGQDMASIAQELGGKSYRLDGVKTSTQKLTEMAGVPNANRLVGDIFKAEEGRATSAIELDDTTLAFVKVGRVQPARPQTFEEALNDLKEEFRLADESQKLLAKATQLLSARLAGTPLETLARDNNLREPLQTLVGITRSGPMKTDLLEDTQRDELFRTAKGSAVSVPLRTAKGMALVEVTDITAGKVNDDELARLKDAMASQFGSDLFQQAVTALRKDYPTDLRQDVIRQAFGTVQE